jgi:hypothetical protein
MKHIHLLQIKRHTQGEAKIIHFSLPGLLEAVQILALNSETRILFLLFEGPKLIVDQQFSINELRIILPILESFPHYSPYEVLLAYLVSDAVTANSIARCRENLQKAQTLGTWQQELRPLRRGLSSLRQKLHPFDLEISNIRERGCSLTSWTSYQGGTVKSGTQG